jgi:MOSC domain-containing protein YiiM
VLEVSCPRIPCATFEGWLQRAGWIRQFTQAAVPGAFLRVVEPGMISAGDAIKILRRPSHDVTISLVFRALTVEPELLPLILVADALPSECRETAARRTGPRV